MDFISTNLFKFAKILLIYFCILNFSIKRIVEAGQFKKWLNNIESYLVNFDDFDVKSTVCFKYEIIKLHENLDLFVIILIGYMISYFSLFLEFYKFYYI